MASSDKEATPVAGGETGAATAAAGKEVTGGKMITITSKDDKSFEVTEAAARLSVLLSGMIDEGCTDDGVRLPNITAATLEKVIEYLNKHAEAAADPRVVIGSGGFRAAADEELKKWDAEFVDGLGIRDAFFDLILAADFLEIGGLLDDACKKIADMMIGKTLDEIRATFNILDDYTEQEKAEIRREYAWAFSKGRRSSASHHGDEDREEP